VGRSWTGGENRDSVVQARAAIQWSLARLMALKASGSPSHLTLPVPLRPTWPITAIAFYRYALRNTSRHTCEHAARGSGHRRGLQRHHERNGLAEKSADAEKIAANSDGPGGCAIAQFQEEGARAGKRAREINGPIPVSQNLEVISREPPYVWDATADSIPIYLRRRITDI